MQREGVAVGFFYRFTFVDFFAGAEFMGFHCSIMAFAVPEHLLCLPDTVRYCKPFISAYTNVFLIRNSEHLCDDNGLALSRWAPHR